MNNIFSKNIEALKLKNPKLASKLQTYIVTDIPQLTMENNVCNLLYKNRPVHNQKNPLGEAIEIFSMAENTPVSVHLVYGLGLGYLFQVVSKNSKGNVILYEPDLNLMWIAFTLVDFSADILKENVYISDDYDEITDALYKKSGMKNTPQLLSIPSQREYNPIAFQELVNKLQMLIGTYNLDLKFTKQKFYPSLRMLLMNIPNLLKEIPLINLKDKFKGKTGVVVSAGPTLDRNLEILKKHREKYVLLVVGAASQAVAKYGIKPDFIVQIETFHSTRQMKGVNLDGITLITEPYSHPALRRMNFERTFSHISANSPINQFWSEICGEKIDEYWTKGTVSYTALNCARILGCSKIILVGQDLAYIDGQCYSKDSAYKDLYCGLNPETNCWEIMAKDFEKFAEALSPTTDIDYKTRLAKNRLRNLNKSLHLVKGIQGDMLPTESVYAAFVEPLKEFAEHFNNIKYINTSLIGAQIDGFENLDLETALKDSEIIQDRNFSLPYEYKKDLIKHNLEKLLEELHIATKLLDECEKSSRNLDNELKRYRSATVEVLKSLKKVSMSYLFLSSDFTDKSKIFDFITVSDKIDLDYEMKMTESFTYESVKNINDKISLYVQNAKNRIQEIDSIIRKAMDESFNSES